MENKYSTIEKMVNGVVSGYREYPVLFISMGVVMIVGSIALAIILHKHNKRIERMEIAIERWVKE